ncbi:MAG: trypsin-like peptidase domain-containing protein, partial [Oscillospiraceae bacterium]
MTPKQKKSKLPIILLLVAALTLSTLGGVMLGKYAQNKGANWFDPQISFGQIFKGELPKENTANSDDAGSLIEIKPVPENVDGGYETTAIYKKVNPSVVSINVYASTSVSPIGAGTGIVMTEDGYIMTNAHVVADGTSVNVIFEDGSQARGVIVGADIDTDLAVVKVEKTGLVAAEFGDSTALETGERVVAIGNAGGLSSTITQGIISGLNRDLKQGGRTLDLIQVDAAINPGNSGGPLINRYGQVVGINSSKIASVDFEGIGFSIPITEAMPIVESIVKYGYVTGRAVLGVSVVSLNPSNGPINGLPAQGQYIAENQEGSD